MWIENVVILMNKRKKEAFDAFRLNVKTGKLALITENLATLRAGSQITKDSFELVSKPMGRTIRFTTGTTKTKVSERFAQPTSKQHFRHLFSLSTTNTSMRFPT